MAQNLVNECHRLPINYDISWDDLKLKYHGICPKEPKKLIKIFQKLDIKCCKRSPNNKNGHANIPDDYLYTLLSHWHTIKDPVLEKFKQRQKTRDRIYQQSMDSKKNKHGKHKKIPQKSTKSTKTIQPNPLQHQKIPQKSTKSTKHIQPKPLKKQESDNSLKLDMNPEDMNFEFDDLGSEHSDEKQFVKPGGTDFKITEHHKDEMEEARLSTLGNIPQENRRFGTC